MRRWLAVMFFIGLPALLGGGILMAAAQEDAEDEACPQATGQTVEIATARLFIEYNAAADDLGVHGAFDDHGWSALCVFDPSGQLVLAVQPQGQMGPLGLAGIFFESREPVLAAFGFAELAAAFPAGEYAVRGLNVDGTALVGAARFTHDVPAKPILLSPSVAAEEDQAGDSIVPLNELVIAWEPVTQTVDGRPVTITGYQVIVTRLQGTDAHGFSLPIYDVHVPPDRTRLPVPVEFLEANTAYEVEVLALEWSGNQTIAGGYFTVQ